MHCVAWEMRWPPYIWYLRISIPCWVVSTDQRNLYRSNGVNRSSASYSLGIGYSPIGMNTLTPPLERSDWAVAAVAVYNCELTLAEILTVEDHFISVVASKCD